MLRSFGVRSVTAKAGCRRREGIWDARCYLSAIERILDRHEVFESAELDHGLDICVFGDVGL